MGAVALALGLAVTMTPVGALAPAGEAHAATTSVLEGGAATAATNRVSQDVVLTAKDRPAIMSGVCSLEGESIVQQNNETLTSEEAYTEPSISSYATAVTKFGRNGTLTSVHGQDYYLNTDHLWNVPGSPKFKYSVYKRADLTSSGAGHASDVLLSGDTATAILNNANNTWSEYQNGSKQTCFGLWPQSEATTHVYMIRCMSDGFVLSGNDEGTEVFDYGQSRAYVFKMTLDANYEIAGWYINNTKLTPNAAGRIHFNMNDGSSYSTVGFGIPLNIYPILKLVEPKLTIDSLGDHNNDVVDSNGNTITNASFDGWTWDSTSSSWSKSIKYNSSSDATTKDNLKLPQRKGYTANWKISTDGTTWQDIVFPYQFPSHATLRPTWIPNTVQIFYNPGSPVSAGDEVNLIASSAGAGSNATYSETYYFAPTGGSQAGSDSPLKEDFSYRGHDQEAWYVGTDTPTSAIVAPDGANYSGGAGFVYAMLTDANAAPDRVVNLHAKWKKGTYTVTLRTDETILKKDGDGELDLGTFAGFAEDKNNDGAGTGVWKKSYTYGDEVKLPGPNYTHMAGYVFTEWKAQTDILIGDTSDQKIKAGNTIDLTALSGSQYGDIELYPVLEEKKYTVNYDLEGCGALASGGTTDEPAEAAETGESAGSTIVGTATFSYDDMYANGGAGTALAAVAEQSYKGWKFAGWTPRTALTAGVDPADSEGAWDAFSRNAYLKMWPAERPAGAESNYAVDTDATNAQPGAITLYAVWDSGDTVELTLDGANPATAPGKDESDGEEVALEGGLGVKGSAPTAQTLYFWPGHGLTYKQGAAAEGSLSGDDPAYERFDVNDPSKNVLAFDDQHVLAAPSRIGYEFMGWGEKVTGSSDGKIKDPVDYVRERAEGDENVNATDGKPSYSDFVLYIRRNDGGTLSLTKSGANVVSGADGTGGWEANGKWQTLQPQTWCAVWKAVEYPVRLRVSATAVDTSGAPSGTWQPSGDNAAGWLQHEKKLPYWSTVSIPAYDEKSSQYTYYGWYSRQSNLDDGDEVVAGGYAKKENSAGSGSGTFTYGTLTAQGAWASEGGVDGHKQFAAGDAGKLLRVTAQTPSDLWLRHRSVQVGVTSSMFVYLLADTYDEGDDIPAGKKVGDYKYDPYVAGDDGRYLLESEITFETSNNTSHDLYVQQVECTDIELTHKDVDGNDVRSGKFASDTLLRTTDSAHGQLPSDATAKVYWLSPVPTVRYDKVGNTNTSTSVDGADGTAEKNRRMFGFYAGSDNKGTGANNKLGASELGGAFVLRMPEAQTDYLKATDVTAAHTTVARDESGEVVADEEGYALDAAGERVTVTELGADTYQRGDFLYRKNTFYYGLDLDKCSITPDSVRNYYRAVSGLGENDAVDGVEDSSFALAKLVFTFGTAQNATAGAGNAS